MRHNNGVRKIDKSRCKSPFMQQLWLWKGSGCAVYPLSGSDWNIQNLEVKLTLKSCKIRGFTPGSCFRSRRRQDGKEWILFEDVVRMSGRLSADPLPERRDP